MSSPCPFYSRLTHGGIHSGGAQSVALLANLQQVGITYLAIMEGGNDLCFRPGGPSPRGAVREKPRIENREEPSRFPIFLGVMYDGDMNAVFYQQLETLLGNDGIRASEAEKRAYAFDAYTLEKHLPGVVALPRTTEQVSAIVRLCAEHNVGVVPRGAGTGLAGGATAKDDQLLLCLSRMNRVLDVDIPNRRLRAQAGAITIQLSKAAMPQGFRYAPDPSSEGASTLGGNIANNSGGPHTLKYGVTVNHVLSAQVVMADGAIVELSQDDAGYDLLGVVVGCEGTLGIVTEATVKLVRLAETTRTMLAVCNNMDDATGLITRILNAGIVPAALEIVDQTILQAVEAAYHLGLADRRGRGACWWNWTARSAGMDQAREQSVIALCKEPAMRFGWMWRKTKKSARNLWMARKKSVATIGRIGAGVRDPRRRRAAHQTPRRAARNRRYRRKIQPPYRERVPRRATAICIPPCCSTTKIPTRCKRVMAAGGEILRACVAHGGSLTGEHGIGLEKQEFLGLVFSDADIAAMMAVRGVFDPESRMNPGKLFPAGGNCCPHMPRMDNETLLGLTKTRANAV